MQQYTVQVAVAVSIRIPSLKIVHVEHAYSLVFSDMAETRKRRSTSGGSGLAKKIACTLRTRSIV